MQKKRTGRMLCSLALSAVTLWGVSVTAPAKDARDALRSLKDETLGVMLNASDAPVAVRVPGEMLWRERLNRGILESYGFVLYRK